jgi:ElaB/YqjD/DUF883 family membrane-anchored ribosome-binding protein
VASPLTRNEIRELIDDLEELLKSIGRGELDASNGTLLRIEGAINVLRIVLGEGEGSGLI